MNYGEVPIATQIQYSTYENNAINNNNNTNNYIGQQRGFNDLYSNQNNINSMHVNNIKNINYVNDPQQIICSSPKRQRLDDSQRYQNNNNHIQSNIQCNNSNSNTNSSLMYTSLLNNIFGSFHDQCNNNNISNINNNNRVNTMDTINPIINNESIAYNTSAVNNNNNNNNAFTSSPTPSTNSTNNNNNAIATNDTTVPALDPIISPKIEQNQQIPTNNQNNHNTLNLPSLIGDHDESNGMHQNDMTDNTKDKLSDNMIDMPPIIYHNNNSSTYNYFPDFCNVPPQIDPFAQIIAGNNNINDVSNIMDDNTNNSIINNMINDTISVMQSASCHQCKTKKDVNILFYCTKTKPKKHIAYKTKSIKCKKKYCSACMTKYFNESDVAKFKKYKNSASWSFDCPSCQGVCTCGACKRRRAKNQINK